MGLARQAGIVGSAIRRLFQRGTSNHRPIPGGQRDEMAARHRSGAVASSRLRRAGTRALERTFGAIPTAVRRGEHAGLLPDDAGTILPFAAPPNASQFPQTAYRYDAEKLASQQGRRVGVG